MALVVVCIVVCVTNMFLNVCDQTPAMLMFISRVSIMSEFCFLCYCYVQFVR